MILTTILALIILISNSIHFYYHYKNNLKYRNIESTLHETHKEYSTKINQIHLKYNNIIDSIRTEQIKIEKQYKNNWINSEAELMHVLNGVNKLIELFNSKIENDDNEIYNKLIDIQKLLNNGKN